MSHSSFRRLFFGILLLGLSVPIAAYAAPVGERPGFPVLLSGARISFGSPTLADITGDGNPEIIVGGGDGKIYAITGAAQILWTFNASAAIDAKVGHASGKPAAIRTAPAVGDINNDGTPDIVVGVGEVFPEPMNGGVVALNKNGQLLPGWPQVPLDFAGGGGAFDKPDGYTDGVLTSPSIADITGDGKPEVIFGANDQRVYAKDGQGNNLPGWPQFVLDTVWSSPAVADLNGDGKRDVIIGVDAHNYTGPPRNSENGGDLYVFNGDGSIQWRAHQDEIFQSSPAVADLDGDGKPEIAAGTGTYYGNVSAQPNTIGRYFSVWNHDGSLLWRTPLPERVFGSPAIGDINGDGKLEVVVGALNGKMYAFNGATGAILWSTLGRDVFNNQFIPNPELFSPVLADFDGDGKNDVFAALAWDVVVMKGTNGSLLTGTSSNDARPSFHGTYTVLGTPAIGDLNGDGKLDLVQASGDTNQDRGLVHSWRLGNSTLTASWPLFRHDVQHTGVLPQLVAPASISAILQTGSSRSYSYIISRSDNQQLSWSIAENDPANIVSLNRTSGSSGDELVVTLKAPNTTGSYSASFTIQTADLSPVTVEISVLAADQVYDTFLPMAR